MCVISVLNYLLSIIILWGGRVEYANGNMVAFMVLSFSPPLMKTVCFCSTGLYAFLI